MCWLLLLLQDDEYWCDDIRVFDAFFYSNATTKQIASYAFFLCPYILFMNSNVGIFKRATIHQITNKTSQFQPK